MTTREEAIAKVVGGTPETAAKFVDQLIELGEFMPGVKADADVLLPLADRLWRVHPRELQDLNITRQEFYEREILAVVSHWYGKALEYKQMHEMAVRREQHLEAMLRDRATSGTNGDR